MPSAHDALLKELEPQRGMKVLDIGSGNGETVLTIAEKVGPTGKAVGIDFSLEAITLAREKAKQRNERLYCGCVGGAVSLDEYVEMMKKAGLVDIKTIDFTKDAKRMMNTNVLAQALDVRDDREFQEIVDFVRKGGVGYALLTGTKGKG